MQKSLSELAALLPEDVADLVQHMNEPLLVTHNGEPRFVAQSLQAFESMVRRLQTLEAAQRNSSPGGGLSLRVCPAQSAGTLRKAERQERQA
jgi:hypothetical protein